jgi:hypothetical protein
MDFPEQTTTGVSGGRRKPMNKDTDWAAEIASGRQAVWPSREEIHEAVVKAYEDGFKAGLTHIDAELEEKYIKVVDMEGAFQGEFDSVYGLVNSHKADTESSLAAMEAMVVGKTADIIPSTLSSVDERVAHLKDDLLAFLNEGMKVQKVEVQSKLDAGLASLKADLTDLLGAILTDITKRLQDAYSNTLDESKNLLAKVLAEKITHVSMTLKESIDRTASAERTASDVQFRQIKSDLSSLQSLVDSTHALLGELKERSTGMEAKYDFISESVRQTQQQLHLYEQQQHHQQQQPRPPSPRISAGMHGTVSMEPSSYPPMSTESFPGDMVATDDAVSEDGSEVSDRSGSSGAKALQPIPSSTAAGHEVVFVSKNKVDGEVVTTLLPGIVRKVSRALALKVPKWANVNDMVDIDTAQGVQKVVYVPGQKIRIGDALLLAIPTSAKPGKSIVWENVGDEMGVLRYDVEIITPTGAGKVIHTWAKHLRMSKLHSRQLTVRFAPL